MGAQARAEVVHNWSIDTMVHGYERIIETTFVRKKSLSGRHIASLEESRAASPQPSATSGSPAAIA
jgi:hypothetical protein